LLSWAHWDRASDFVTDEEAPWFLFEPQIYIANVFGDTKQFAFSEEPHYVLID
jgi:hypothetical protein